MSFAHLLVAREDGMAVLTLNRPKALNALNAALLDELNEAVAALGADEQVRVLVITGAGDRAFAAGADITELAGQDAAGAHALARRGQALFSRLETLGKPVVAAVNGFALGGGCELAMACTLRLAADTARLGQPEIKLGLLPGYGGTQRLVRLVGKGRALDLLLSGRQIDAEEACRIGLVNRVVPAASLAAEARALARELSAGPAAQRLLLEAVNRGADLPLPDALALEAALFGLAASTADMKEGTRAFLEKRAPAFTGR